jgi:hypothetical protein
MYREAIQETIDLLADEESLAARRESEADVEDGRLTSLDDVVRNEPISAPVVRRSNVRAPPP